MDLQQSPMPELKPIEDKNEVEKYRKKWTKFLFGVETSPLEQQDPRPDLNIIEDKEKYNRSPEIERFHLTYSVEPGTTVRAYLLRPRKRKGKLPGVVLFHQTDPRTIDVAGALDSDPKERQKEIMAADLARHGYVVLCPECFIYGGRTPGEQDAYPDFLAEVKKMRQRHLHWKGLGRMVWDGVRAVDLLVGCKDVDSERIGAVGHSLGAKQVLFVAAFDQRVKASVFSDGGIWLEVSNWYKEWYLGQEICKEGFKLENHQVLAMIAPRAFLLVGGKHDNTRAWPFIKESIPLWESSGKPRDIGWFQHEKGHRWPPEAQEVGFTFLSQYLKRG